MQAKNKIDIKISTTDIIWSYLSQFFSLGTGLIVLPLMLKFLTEDEMGVYYILLSITSIVSLFDLGFSGQFSRFLTYVLSGANELKTEGVSPCDSNYVNTYLLATLIKTAKKIYFYIAVIVFLCLVLFGTIYINYITKGFSIIPNSIIIWVIFCFSSFFNIYYLYYNPFLQGSGLVKESKIALVISKIAYLLIAFICLIFDFGLISIVIANILSPFIFRFIAHYYFFTKDINEILSTEEVTDDDVKSVFMILFHNAKKMGVISILSSVLNTATTLILGVFLSLSEVASYGIMLQIINMIYAISTTHFYSLTPQFASLIVKNSSEELKEKFGFSIFIYNLLSLCGALGMAILPLIFRVCGFNTTLPSSVCLVVYYIYAYLNNNQAMYCQLLLANNNMKFYKSTIICGVSSIVSLYIVLYFGGGILSAIIAISSPVYIYASWKWPSFVSKTYHIDTFKYIYILPCKKIVTHILKYS